MTTPKARDMTVREAGRKGGDVVLKKYGVEFYREIGRRGGKHRHSTKRVPARAPSEITMAEAGRKGGLTVRHTYGIEFYEEIGRKGGQRVRDLVRKGQRAEQREGA